MTNQRAIKWGEDDNSSTESKNDLRVKMKKGYFQMAKINLELAEKGLKADQEVYELL